MKSKSNIYLLSTIVAIIWGLLIYKFFSFTTPAKIETTTNQSVVKPFIFKKHEPVIINTNYRDPFLGSIYTSERDYIKTGLKKKKPASGDIAVWPQVIFKGMVSDTKNKNKIFILLINGKTQMLKENETVDDILLKKGNRKFVDIKYKDEITTIWIQE